MYQHEVGGRLYSTVCQNGVCTPTRGIAGYTIGFNTVEITISDLVNWCEQIACGMEYLATKKVVLNVFQPRFPNSNVPSTLRARLSMGTLLPEMFLSSATTS